MREFALSEWERAQKSLQVARQVLDVDPDSSASRAYYAAFHAVTTLFALKEQEFTKHTALRAAVHRDLVKPGVWPVSLGADFDFLMDMREIGDYGGLTHASPDDAIRAIECSGRIMDAVSRSCNLVIVQE